MVKQKKMKIVQEKYVSNYLSRSKKSVSGIYIILVYFKKHGECESLLLVGGASESFLPVGVESLRFKLGFERKLLVLVKALASGLNDVSITFKVIETIDGDLEDLAVD